MGHMLPAQGIKRAMQAACILASPVSCTRHAMDGSVPSYWVSTHLQLYHSRLEVNSISTGMVSMSTPATTRAALLKP